MHLIIIFFIQVLLPIFSVCSIVLTTYQYSLFLKVLVAHTRTYVSCPNHRTDGHRHMYIMCINFHSNIAVTEFTERG